MSLWFPLAVAFAFLGCLCFLRVVSKRIQLIREVMEYEQKRLASRKIDELEVFD